MHSSQRKEELLAKLRGILAERVIEVDALPSDGIGISEPYLFPVSLERESDSDSCRSCEPVHSLDTAVGKILMFHPKSKMFYGVVKFVPTPQEDLINAEAYLEGKEEVIYFAFSIEDAYPYTRAHLIRHMLFFGKDEEKDLLAELFKPYAMDLAKLSEFEIIFNTPQKEDIIENRTPTIKALILLGDKRALRKVCGMLAQKSQLKRRLDDMISTLAKILYLVDRSDFLPPEKRRAIAIALYKTLSDKLVKSAVIVFSDSLKAEQKGLYKKTYIEMDNLLRKEGISTSAVWRKFVELIRD